MSGTTTASYLSLTGTRTRTREPGMSRPSGFSADAADQDRAGALGVLVVGENEHARRAESPSRYQGRSGTGIFCSRNGGWSSLPCRPVPIS